MTQQMETFMPKKIDKINLKFLKVSIFKSVE